MEITNLLIWRWSVGELVTNFGVYCFMSAVFPIKQGCRWRLWALGYGTTILYLLILFGLHMDPYAGGIALRLLVTLPIYVLIPMLYVEKNGWKYIGFVVANSFISSGIMDAFIMPLIYSKGKFPFEDNVQIDMSYTLYSNKEYAMFFYSWCFVSVLLYLLLIPVYRLLKRWGKVWNFFCNASVVLSIFSFTVLLLSAVGPAKENQVSSLVFAVANSVSVIGCICYGIYQERRKNLLETEVLKMQQQLQEIQAEELLASQTQTRKLRHDLAGHMETLHMLVESGKLDTAKEYAEKVLEEYR